MDEKNPSPVKIPLWEDQVPLSLGTSDEDRPSISIYLPAAIIKPVPAMVIFPGGGYNHLADHEGTGYARWFLTLGMASIVVKYRLGSKGYRHPVMLMDAARSVRLVRNLASSYGIDSKRVGVIGSSAGGHLAAMLLTSPGTIYQAPADPVDHHSSMPNLGILCYPVISMNQYPHQGSRQFLLGDQVSPVLLSEASPETHVRPETPPCFIWHTREDERVSVNHSLLFSSALQKNSTPFELHVYQKGSHGIGLANGHPWTEECRRWLTEYRFISPS